MNYLFSMAFRNIRRNTRRSLLAMISVALAITFIVSMQGMMGGILNSIVKNYTKNETGHIRITTIGFQEKSRFLPVTENISRPDALVAAIKGDPQIARHVLTVTERITFGVLLSNKGNNKTAMALAGDPATEKDLLLLNKALMPGGRYITGRRETIIGARIARDLGFAVGDTLKVVAQGSDRALHMKKFRVVGIFSTGIKTLDDAVFQIPLVDAQQLLRTNGASQQIVIILDNYKRAEATANSIRALLGDDNLSILPWTQIGEYGRMVEFMASIFSLISAAFALLGAFIIGNIMMMVILERRREIGVLKSMGFSRGGILRLFLTEGMALGMIGSICGIVFGAGVSIFFHFHGVDFTKALGSVNMPMDNVIYFTVSAGGLLQALLIGTGISALVSILPAWQAGRMNPVEAMKSV